MRTAHIIYKNYLKPDGNGMSIGGVQTYLANLVVVLQELGYSVIIYQRGDINFQKSLGNNLMVNGYARPAARVKGLSKMLYRHTKEQIDPDRGDILIFGCESFAIEANFRVKSFAIQHGISWDIPKEGLTRIQTLYWYLKKQYYSCKTASRVKVVDHLICVDCNFLNWYKALVPCPQVSLHYIPNFSIVPELCPTKPDPKNGINIIFARRFEKYRGTRLFLSVIQKLLTERNDLNITIAGDGPDEKVLKEGLETFPHVRFIRYQSQESLLIHADKHIAVVPTLGSEGTSLSLLEAMASGCAVVCTNVGGMTNVVIDGYNGLLVTPGKDELYLALKRLIINHSERNSIANRGYDTVRLSFSIDKWKSSWKSVLGKNDNPFLFNQ